MRTLTLIVLLLVAASMPVLSMMMIDKIEGAYYPVSRTPEVSNVLVELGNFPGRVYGERQFFSEIGDTERLYFAGDTEAFNKFLQMYSKLETKPLKLVIMGDEPLPPHSLAMQKGQVDCEGKPVEPTEVAYDWQLMRHVPSKQEESEVVYVLVWPGRMVDRDKIKIPKGVEMDSDPGWEVERLARHIDKLSEGRSKLLTKEPVSANPKVGHIPRNTEWRDTPFITVYPVDQPVRVTLPEYGNGYIIGVVSLLVKATAPNGEGSAATGSYLLFYKTIDVIRKDETGVNYVSLISFSERGNYSSYAEVLKAPLLGHDPVKGCDKPCVTVSFPGKGEVSKENPAWRATVDMLWKEHIYRFALDLDIPMV